MIISKHMETLLNTEAVSSDNHLKDLRCLYDTTESHIRSLKSLGVEATSYGAMLSSVLLAKLPPDLRLIVSRKVSSDDDITMENLLMLFEDELVARERASNPSTSHSQDRGRHSALLSGARESGTNTSFTCCYCRQQHVAKDCTMVTGVSARKQILRNSGRCFNCLRKGHAARLCRTASKCQQCKGRHHTSICGAQSMSGAQSGEVPSLAQTGRVYRPYQTQPRCTSVHSCYDYQRPLLWSTEVCSPTNSSQCCAESPETLKAH